MRYSLSFTALILLVGCRTGPADAPREPQLAASFRPQQVGIGSGWTGLGHPLGDAKELALIAQVKSLYSGEDAARIERQLNSPTVVSMTISNPKAQAIVDQIFSRRKAWSDSVAAARPLSQSVDGPLDNVTVALVDSLADPTATAEIRRRTDMDPHDIILLPVGHATVGALGAAIHGLGKLWANDGQATPLKNMRVVVHGEMHLKSWSTANEQVLNAALTDAAGRQKTSIHGIGSARSFSIYLKQPSAANGKP